jgi:3,5-dihydroxyphenylacetyl-CoA synthase
MNPTPLARLVGVGTAHPPSSYTQEEVLAWSGEQDPKIQRLFRNSHIETRSLFLPDQVDGRPPPETPQSLIDRHLRGALEIGVLAIQRALAAASVDANDLDFLVCTTSTGFLCPSLTAHLVKQMGLKDNLRRVDIVGMGCNAAVNGLHAATGMARARPGACGVLVCIEICSAAYVINPSLTTAVVNSLFGDGAAAVVVRADAADSGRDGPAVVDFEPLILTDAIGAMRYDREGDKLSFFLDRDIPYVIGRHAHVPVERLLSRHGLALSAIRHWVVHSGGKKVLDAIVRNLELPEAAVRHTREVLHRFGNVSSGSVLFSFELLRREGIAAEGDAGVLMAMGPGTSIETALLRW